jgi:hypothetical protein
LRNSGLKVNKVKNEACLFFRKYWMCMPVRI